MQQTVPHKINMRAWVVMAALALTGQIAWAVEDAWFNTFVFDTITPDPRPVAWMVAASAITATLTTLFMGTLSDRSRSRLGRRKPFILFGYILWGIVHHSISNSRLYQALLPGCHPGGCCRFDHDFLWFHCQRCRLQCLDGGYRRQPGEGSGGRGAEFQHVYCPDCIHRGGGYAH